jgi:uncharacterized protein YjbJ (UPF0337 family)
VDGDKIIGKVKEAAGAAVGNEALEREGRVQQDKAMAEAEAERLDERAEVRAEQAELEARQREIELEQQRIEAEAAEQARFDRIEAEEAEEKARLQAAAAELEAESAKAEHAADLLDGTRQQLEG